MFPRRCRWSPMVQESLSGPKRFWALPQDRGRGSLLSVFYPFGNQQNVSKLEEEFLVDENEVRDSEVRGWMWHMSKSQGQSFETSRKLATLEHSRVEMEKHMYGLHWGLPRTSHRYNFIWVIADRLTKSSPFILVSTTCRVRQYAELYMSHIVRYHGIPKIIISNRGSIFVAHFLEQLHNFLGTLLIWSSIYHP
jgi:hypothetical protein